MTHRMSDVSYPPFSEMRVLAVPDESSSRTSRSLTSMKRTVFLIAVNENENKNV